MRLIDADKLKKIIHSAYSDDLEILDKIDEQPTVFDVNEVVKQIKDIKEKEYTACSEQACGYCRYLSTCSCGDKADKLALDRAIEIVKEGGVECANQY